MTPESRKQGMIGKTPTVDEGGWHGTDLNQGVGTRYFKKMSYVFISHGFLHVHMSYFRRIALKR